MVKNKVVLKERDAWSDLANFIGEMVAKYADAMELDQLPDPDNYLRMKRIKQLYMELYKIENIEKSRSIVISIERMIRMDGVQLEYFRGEFIMLMGRTKFLILYSFLYDRLG